MPQKQTCAVTLLEMYKGIAFSPQAALADNISATETIIPVTDISAFPEAPSYATIGTDEGGETILYAAKTDAALSGCTRGIEGAAQAWQSGTTIARNFTNADFAAIQKNIRQQKEELYTHTHDAAQVYYRESPLDQALDELAEEFASRMEEIDQDISASYAACAEKGAQLPEVRNSENLPATILSIKGGGGPIDLVPMQLGGLVYNGQAQSPQWNGFDPEKLELGGVTSGTNAGSYAAQFTPKEGYYWADDGSTGARTSPWSIARQPVAALPSQSGTLTYTGAAQTPAWANYDPVKLTIGGATNGTNAGSYQAHFTPTGNYCWADGSAALKTVAWTIAKAPGSLNLSAASLSLDITSMSKAITVTRAGDGAITAVSSNTSVASVNVSGNIITVTGQGAGSASITVQVEEGANHTAPAAKTASVSVSLPSTVLDENSWDVIRAVSDRSMGERFWEVGDCKAVTLNGTVGILTLSNFTCYVFILGFNHNAALEGASRIHFAFGKTARTGGTDIAFVDSEYGNRGTSVAFRMNLAAGNSKGWEGSYMRTTICKQFENVIPAALRSVFKTVTKYSDNIGGTGITGSEANAARVTSTTDIFYLLSELEVMGITSHANSYEANKQRQYEYYKAGNSQSKYKHDSTETRVPWFSRSVVLKSGIQFVYILRDNYTQCGYANASYAFSPAFCV